MIVSTPSDCYQLGKFWVNVASQKGRTIDFSLNGDKPISVRPELVLRQAQDDRSQGFDLPSVLSLSKGQPERGVMYYAQVAGPQCQPDAVDADHRPSSRTSAEKARFYQRTHRLLIPRTVVSAALVGIRPGFGTGERLCLPR